MIWSLPRKPVLLATVIAGNVRSYVASNTWSVLLNNLYGCRHGSNGALYTKSVA